MSNLLINEPPLQVLPSLAVEIGLNEAIILQQIHYWTQPRGQWEPQQHDGKRWVYNTYAEWVTQFPFWSERTVRRALSSLEKQGLVVTAQPRKQHGNSTKWYRIDYGALQRLDTESTPSGQDGHTPSGQNDHPPVDKVATPSGQDGQSRAYSKERARGRDYAETTTEKASSTSGARDGLEFLPEKHQYLESEIRSNLDAYRNNQVDFSHLAKRLLARGNTGYPKTVVAGHIRDYPTEHVIAAWTIAASSATSNWTKYADTILREGFREQSSARRPGAQRRDAGSSDVASGPDGRMGQWGEYA